jgi:putative ABC transport system permease protein
MEIGYATAGPRYFTNMKVPFTQGRDFDERDRDGAPCVAIVNEAFTGRYFGGASPLGKHLAKYGRRKAEKEWCEVVGVIRDDAWQTLHEVRPFYSMALQQSDERDAMLLVTATTDAKTLISPVRQIIKELDRNIPLGDVQTLQDYFSFALYPFRLLGAVMAGCGLTALLLAAIGIYGLISYSVAQRTREVGIRMALGAERSDILKLVLRQGMVLVMVGLGVGLLLGVALTRVLTSGVFDADLLFGVSATDSLTFVAVTVLLALVALVACYIPALRATRVDPVEALRST